MANRSPVPISPRTLPLLLGAIAVFVLGCGDRGPRSEIPPPPPGWADSLADYRERADRYFASAESPLAAAERPGFSGLAYYPPDPGMRFVLEPDTRGAGEQVSFPDTKGNPRRYRVHCRLHFEMEDATFSLIVYESEGTEGHLFLPFQDATTGSETYEVGRYVDVGRLAGGKMVVDFNYAKNPYCAYNEDWACPLVPPENRVSIPIRVGEKDYSH